MSQSPFDFSDFRGAAQTSQGASDGDSGPGHGYFPGSHRGGEPGSPGSGASLTVSRPPVGLLWAAIAAAVLGAVLAALAGGRPWLAVSAWALAGPAAFALLGAFTAKDTRQRATSLYAAPTWLRLAYRGGATLVVVAVVMTALRIAEWVGRL